MQTFLSLNWVNVLTNVKPGWKDEIYFHNTKQIYKTMLQTCSSKHKQHKINYDGTMSASAKLLVFI